MFVRTERLMLRPGWPEDAPALTAAIAHEGVVKRLSRVPWPYREDDASAWLGAAERPPSLRLLILDRVATVPRIVGGIGLHREEDGLALGYWLTPALWGRGYATEAARGVTDFARHGLRLKRLVASHHVDNPASGRVLRKLGFRATGRTRMQFCAARGHAVETAPMELDLADGSRSDPAMPIAA